MPRRSVRWIKSTSNARRCAGAEERIGRPGSDDRFARCKPGIRLINTARGELIDEAALKRAIEKGLVGGAGLDVFETEPPADWSLAQLPQVRPDRAAECQALFTNLLQLHQVYANIGALDALRDYLRERERSMDDLLRAAEVCRIARITMPYVEAIA